MQHQARYITLPCLCYLQPDPLYNRAQTTKPLRRRRSLRSTYAGGELGGKSKHRSCTHATIARSIWLLWRYSNQFAVPDPTATKYSNSILFYCDKLVSQNFINCLKFMRTRLPHRWDRFQIHTTIRTILQPRFRTAPPTRQEHNINKIINIMPTSPLFMPAPRSPSNPYTTLQLQLQRKRFLISQLSQQTDTSTVSARDYTS